MSKKIVKYILMILGLIIFLAGYFLVYMDYTAKTDAANEDIKKLSQRLDVLNGYKAELGKYEESIAKDTAAVNNILDRYTSMERPEDFLMMTTAMEKDVGLSIGTQTFADPTAVYAFKGLSGGNGNKDPLKQIDLTCFMLSSTISGSMTYDQMKQALDYIDKQKDATRLNTLDMNYDSSTGLINGSFILDKYYITGRDMPEYQTDIPYSDFGKSVLIGS
jgi:hypothetical protein